MTDRVITPPVEDDIMQILRGFNRIFYLLCGIENISRGYCRFETSTRYVPANTGSFLKSLESDVSAL